MIGNVFSVLDLKSELHLPQSIHGCYSFLDLSESPFKEFIVCMYVCPSCNMLYSSAIHTLVYGTYSQCQLTKCSFTEFPNHPQWRFRLPYYSAHAVLFFSIKYNEGIKFHSNHGKSTITFNQPNFLMMCNALLQKEPEKYLADITDGGVEGNDVLTFTR